MKIIKKTKALIFSIIFFFSCAILYAANREPMLSPRKTAFIYYDDEGTFDYCYHSLSQFFKNRNYAVQEIKADEINSGKILMENCEQKILAFPGGADCFYQINLRGKGCDNIKKFVENDGTYLGVCGGSYFGTAKVEFALGLPEQVNQFRELGFFPGIARGPAKGIFKYGDESGASAAKIKITSNGKIFYVYHNGGPTFVPFEDDPEFKKADPRFKGYEVLATFSEVEDKPAIIKCNYGKGYAILSGVHFEDSSKQCAKGIREFVASTEDVMNEFLDKIFPRQE